MRLTTSSESMTCRPDNQRRAVGLEGELDAGVERSPRLLKYDLSDNRSSDRRPRSEFPTAAVLDATQRQQLVGHTRHRCKIAVDLGERDTDLVGLGVRSA